jgi:hypothetical protein
MPDCGTGRAVLAVPSVSVEEDQVSFAGVVDHFVDADEPLNRGSAAALFQGVEVEDPDHLPHRRRLRAEWSAV